MVACKLGLKEIPASEVKSEEAIDYVVYYCSRD